MTTKYKITVGKNAYISDSHDPDMSNDYEGMSGVIEWCGKCCSANRVQFDDIANNEPLRKFNILKCLITKYEE